MRASPGPDGLISFDPGTPTSVWAVKEHIQAVTHIPAEHQRLILHGRHLEDGETLDDHIVGSHSVIELKHDNTTCPCVRCATIRAKQSCQIRQGMS